MRKASITAPVKPLICAVALLLFLPASLFSAENSVAPEPPRTQIERESYSIGYQIGIGMKIDSVEVDFENVLQGMHDAVNGKKPLLEKEEMKQLIVDLKKRGRELALRRSQEQIVKNAQESEKFLAENGKKPDIQTTESGLQYKILREGTGTVPGQEDTVRVNYRGMFIDGKEFDSSYEKGEPQTIQVDGVIKGWTEALRMMKTGSKLQIFVPPSLAYGRSGLEPKIPPNKVLVFEIELLSVEKKESGR